MNSAMNRLSPRLRLVVCGLFALAVTGLTHLPVLALALAMAVVAALVFRTDPGTALRRLLAVDGFMLFVLAALPFTVPGEAVVTVAGWSVSGPGLVQAGQILLKSNAVVLMVLALLGNLDPAELGQALAGLGCPAKFVHLFQFTVRYLEVLGREYRRLRTAMKARGFVMRCDRHTWRSLGYLFGMLLVQSLERSERISAAMRCRGFSGRFPALADPPVPGRRDHGFAVVAAVACLILVTLEHA